MRERGERVYVQGRECRSMPLAASACEGGSKPKQTRSTHRTEEKRGEKESKSEDKKREDREGEESGGQHPAVRLYEHGRSPLVSGL